MILIGSRALALRAPQALLRAPKDFDWVCTKEEFDAWLKENAEKVGMTKCYPIKDSKKMIVEGLTNCEFDIIQPGSSDEMMLKLVSEDPETIHTEKFGMVPSLDMLFTIKSSHKYLKNSPHFWKNLVDYHVMKKIGAKVRDEYQEFFKKRQEETYTYAHPKLNQSKEDFFKDDGIQYQYDHDSIHEAIAIYDKPAYTYYQKDGSEVQTSKAKFFSVSEDIRLAGVMEEAAVLAIERSLIPHPGIMTADRAWKFALMKVCSSITSGWFREYAYEHALEVLKKYPEYKYWDKFQEGLKNGTVKPFKGKTY